MKHVIPIDGPNLVGITVETVDSAVRVILNYRDDHVMAFLLTSTEAIRLSTAFYAAARHHIRAEGGGETS